MTLLLSRGLTMKSLLCCRCLTMTLASKMTSWALHISLWTLWSSRGTFCLPPLGLVGSRFIPEDSQHGVSSLISGPRDCYLDIVILMLLSWCCYLDVVALMLLSRCCYLDVILMLLSWCCYLDVCVVILMSVLWSVLWWQNSSGDPGAEGLPLPRSWSG